MSYPVERSADAAVESVLRALDVPEDLAQRHLARLEAARAGRENVVPLRPRRGAVRATVGGAVLAATLVSGAGIAAASTAQPGDALYGLKTARERLQLSMARDGDSRARLELKLARTRLGEAAALLRDGNADLAVETLARADAALASAGAHGGALIDDEVAGELDRRVEVLGGLLDGGLPNTAADAALEALERALLRGGRARADDGDAPGRSGDAPGRGGPKPTRGAEPADVTPTSPPAGSPEPKPGRSGHPNGPPTEIPSRTDPPAGAR